MSDYRVAPQALRMNVKFLYDAADAWEAAHKALNGKEFTTGDLGRLGQIDEVTRRHNDALVDVLTALRYGVEALQQAGDSLNGVATAYEAKDAEYYEKFGFLG